MELDLTRLNGLAYREETPPEKQPHTSPIEPLLDGRQYKNTPNKETPAEGLVQDVKDKEIEVYEVYRAYQDNIKKSGQLQTEILKGAKAGEDIYSLLLKAAKAISLMTSNTVFYSRLEADTRAIYGAGLLQPQPLRAELEAVQERLTRLREALQRDGEPEDSRQRIRSAVTAHEARAEQLQELIRQTEGGES